MLVSYMYFWKALEAYAGTMQVFDNMECNNQWGWKYKNARKPQQEKYIFGAIIIWMTIFEINS